MLRLVSRSSTASPPSPRRVRSLLISTTTAPTRPSPSSMARDYTPGDPIRFEQTRGQDWTPGQPIMFSDLTNGNGANAEPRAGPEARAKPRRSSRKSNSLPKSTPPRLASPSTCRATLDSSPNPLADISASSTNASWPVSHPWDPPSPSTTAATSDISFGSTARFSPSRSYAKVSRGSSGAAGSSQAEVASKVKHTRDLATKRSVPTVGAAVQTTPPRASPAPRPRQTLGPKLSKAEMDDLVSGVDFGDDSFDLDAEMQSTQPVSTSTPLKTLSQVEVDDITRGVNLEEDLELTDEETSADYHSADGSLHTSSIGDASAPAPSSSRSDRRSSLASSPRIILKGAVSSTTKKSPGPALPANPDVFTLSSTPPRPSPSVPAVTRRPVRSTRGKQSIALRAFSTYASSANSSRDSSLVNPDVLRGWADDSMPDSIIDADDSVEILEDTAKSVRATTTTTTGKSTKGKEKQVVEDKENRPAEKPGYFVRPASHAASAVPPPTTKAARSTKPTGRAATSLNSEPRREAFKGRGAEDRFKNAHKQWEVRQKWPTAFDYKTWSTRRPEVVYTKDSKEVRRVLETMKGPLGFDLEWDPWVVRTKSVGKTALVQVCDEATILLVHVAQMSAFPKALQELIEDDSRIKLGVQIAGDARKLTNDFKFRPKGLLELNNVVRRYDPQRSRPSLVGLQDLVGMYLDRYLPKDPSIRCGLWSGQLSPDQLNYGANDVYSSLQVLKALDSLAASATGAALDLDALKSASLVPFRGVRPGSIIRPAASGAVAASSPLASLTARKLEAYTLFQVEKRSLADITATMCETTSIKQSSVVWNLLSLYAGFKAKDQVVEFDEDRLVGIVDEIGDSFAHRLKDEHGQLVDDLRKKVAAA
ncbi:hypothetical protein JCM10212_005823 [Sporobolomyces blumeae]